MEKKASHQRSELHNSSMDIEKKLWSKWSAVMLSDASIQRGFGRKSVYPPCFGFGRVCAPVAQFTKIKNEWKSLRIAS